MAVVEPNTEPPKIGFDGSDGPVLAPPKPKLPNETELAPFRSMSASISLII